MNSTRGGREGLEIQSRSKIEVNSEQILKKCVLNAIFLFLKMKLQKADKKRETNTMKRIFPGWIYVIVLKACYPARVVGGATGGGAGGSCCWVNNAGIIDWNYSQLIGILDPV